MLSLRIAIVGAILALTCTAAAADEVSEDLRCLIVSLQLMQSGMPEIVTAATMSHMYWLGRLDGRAPTLDLEESIVSELPAMEKPGFLQGEAQRCGAIMVERGRQEKELGERLKDRAQKALQLQNSR